MEPAELDLVSQYFDERQSQKGTKEQSITARKDEIRFAVNILDELGGRLDTLTTRQALQVINRIRKMGPVDDGGDGTLSRNYTRRTMVTFKSFLMWYAENGGNLDQKKIKPIKAPGMDFSAKKSDDLLTTKEIEKVIEVCSNSRDRAIIATLYDGSFRPGEIIAMKWGDLERDDYGIRTLIKTPKTGKERPIRFTYAVPYLNQWETDYPLPLTQDSPLFVQTVKHSHQYAPLTKDGLSMFIRRLREKTGIEKLKPSIFRPSKITHDVEEGTDLQYVMIKNWGTLKTPMIDVYAKVGQDYVDKVALGKVGTDIKKTTKKPGRTLKPTQCPECGTWNISGAQYCTECAAGLTPEARARKGTVLDVLSHMATEDPEGLIEAIKNYKKES